MVFRKPEAPPEFKNLLTVLNNSGIVRDNPALYQVIKGLIDNANKLLGVVNLIVPTEGTENVNVTGVVAGVALEGQGTPESPLNVRFDGTTVDVNASNQLESLVGGGNVNGIAPMTVGRLSQWTDTLEISDADAAAISDGLDLLGT